MYRFKTWNIGTYKCTNFTLKYMSITNTLDIFFFEIKIMAGNNQSETRMHDYCAVWCDYLVFDLNRIFFMRWKYFKNMQFLYTYTGYVYNHHFHRIFTYLLSQLKLLLDSLNVNNHKRPFKLNRIHASFVYKSFKEDASWKSDHLKS